MKERLKQWLGVTGMQQSIEALQLDLQNQAVANKAQAATIEAQATAIAEQAQLISGLRHDLDLLAKAAGQTMQHVNRVDQLFVELCQAAAAGKKVAENRQQRRAATSRRQSRGSGSSGA